MPLDEEDEEVDQGRPPSATSSKDCTPEYEELSPRFFGSKELVAESEVSPDVNPSHIPPSPSSAIALSNTTPVIRVSDDSSSPQTFLAALPVVSRVQSEKSALVTEPEADDSRVGVETPAKR